jgi:hypothetical protein
MLGLPLRHPEQSRSLHGTPGQVDGMTRARVVSGEDSSLDDKEEGGCFQWEWV